MLVFQGKDGRYFKVSQEALLNFLSTSAMSNPEVEEYSKTVQAQAVARKAELEQKTRQGELSVMINGVKYEPASADVEGYGWIMPPGWEPHVDMPWLIKLINPDYIPPNKSF